MVEPPGTIRPARSEDRAAMMALIETLGLFPPRELDEVRELLAGYFDPSSARDNAGQFWVVDAPMDGQNGMAGVAYYAAERMTLGTWNLYLIGVHPDRRNQGRGAALLRYVEQALHASGERLLFVETSGLSAFEVTRAFYRRCGFEEEARIRDFYAANDDKIVFRKALASFLS